MKSLLSLILAICILASQLSLFAAATSTNYLAIQANKYGLGKNVKVNGAIIKGDMEDYSSAIFYLLSEENIVSKVDKDQQYVVDEPLYCTNEVKLEADTYVNNTVLASKNAISIKGKSLTSEGASVIYSNNGDIVIDCDRIDFTGIIYAPEGKVTIKSKNGVIKGCIIADEVSIHSNGVQLSPDENSENLVSFLKGYRNEGYMCFHAYMEEDGLGVYCDSNLNMNMGMVYVRYDDEKGFNNVGEFETNEGTIEGFDFDHKIDVIVKGRTAFGEVILSDVISMEKDDTGQINYIKQDSDQDGIEDGIELYYLKSDPYNADTDGDGIEDGIEAFYLYTDPTKENDGEIDTDGDGIPDGEEVHKNSNPFLADTDFDGIKDNKDKTPRNYNVDTEIEEVPTMPKGTFDRIITYIDEDGNWKQYLYDFINEKVKMEQEDDLTVSYYYDYDGNLSSKITSYDGDIAVDSYEYDGENVTAIYHNGYKYSILYDEQNRLKIVGLNNATLVSYDYTDDSQKISYANGSYQMKNWVKHAVGVETGINGDWTYSYDAANNCEIYEYQKSGLTVTYFYDENNDLQGVETNTGFGIAYDKREDENGNITNITYTIDDEQYTQINQTEYEEQTGKRITSTLFNGDNISKYYDANGVLYEKLTIGNDTYTNKIQLGDSSEVKTIVYPDNTSMEYSYDGYGNIVKVEENGIVVREYAFDVLNRLVSEIDESKGIITYYEYDLNDNIKASKTYMYADHQKGELVSCNFYEYSDEYGDQLIEFNGKSITYDESGKPLTYYDGSKFTWEGDYLAQASVKEKEIEFVQDNNGTVVKKTVDGVDTIYEVEGADYIAETTDGKTIVYLYDSDAKLIGFIYGDNTYYYVKNALDDVIKIIDSKNEFVCSYQYDAWGNVTEMKGDQEIAGLNKFRYRSYYYDTDMELYYLHSRYYDSMTGRFISTDQIEMMVYNEDNLNLYAYCKNNPIRYIDPEGTKAKVVVFYLDSLERDGKQVISDVKKYYGAANVDVDSQKTSNFDEIESKWNNLGATGVVIIVTHGKPTKLINERPDSTLDQDSLTCAEIANLEYKSVSALIIMGCNAGHYDYAWSNVACRFSSKVAGCVVASDGTVDPNFSGGVAYFSSIADITFYSYCNPNQKRTNHGWTIYTYGRTSKRVKIMWNNILTIRIDNLMVYLAKNSFYLTYK